MTAATPSGRVLVLGDGDLAALAIVRSLGRSGLEVHLASFEATPVTRHSRYVAACHRLGHPLADETLFVNAIFRLLDQTPFDLVIPTSDKSLVPLMAHRDAINRRSRFVAPSQRGFHVTNRKNETITLARSCGLRVPRTILVEKLADFGQLDVGDSFPIVLKPIVSHSPGRVDRNAVRVVHSQDELWQRLPQMLDACPVLIQDFCPGHGIGVSVLACSGTVSAAFQHARVHEPPEGGAGSYRKSTPLSADLLDGVTRFCAALEWDGPAMFEFKQRSPGDPPVLMEVNGRFWGSLALAVHAGVDFPRLLYDAAVLGKTTRIFDYRVPFYVRHTLRDLGWLYRNSRTPPNRPDLLRVGWPTIASELLNLARGREGLDLESISDPAPALAGWYAFAREAAGTIAARADHARRVRRAKRRMLSLRGSMLLARRLRAARSVLFVCQGNINRSAIAEQALRQDGLTAAGIRIASAGFDRRAGRRSTPLSIGVADALQLDIGEHRSTPLTADMLAEFDLIVAMELDHIARIEAMQKEAAGKCIALALLDPADTVLNIPDPDGKSRATFEQVYTRVLRCVGELRRHLSASAHDTVEAQAMGQP